MLFLVLSLNILIVAGGLMLLHWDANRCSGRWRVSYMALAGWIMAVGGIVATTIMFSLALVAANHPEQAQTRIQSEFFLLPAQVEQPKPGNQTF